jgi:hypothetical protein
LGAVFAEIFASAWDAKEGIINARRFAHKPRRATIALVWVATLRAVRIGIAVVLVVAKQILLALGFSVVCAIPADLLTRKCLFYTKRTSRDILRTKETCFASLRIFRVARLNTDRFLIFGATRKTEISVVDGAIGVSVFAARTAVSFATTALCGTCVFAQTGFAIAKCFAQITV